MGTVRSTKRSARTARSVPSVAIAGYTNAGKSSLLNRLTGAGVLVENALFATLDPTVRRATASDGREFTLTDTVGFVRHLPHQLVEAFRSTLEEVAAADLILHVVDGSDADPESQIAAVREVFGDIGALGLSRDHRGQQGRRGRSGGAERIAVARSPTRSSCRRGPAKGFAELVERLEAGLPHPADRGRRARALRAR